MRTSTETIASPSNKATHSSLMGISKSVGVQPPVGMRIQYFIKNMSLFGEDQFKKFELRI